MSVTTTVASVTIASVTSAPDASTTGVSAATTPDLSSDGKQGDLTPINQTTPDDELEYLARSLGSLRQKTFANERALSTIRRCAFHPGSPSPSSLVS